MDLPSATILITTKNWKEDMLRVLHIVPATPYGGLQKQAADLAAEQSHRGLQIRVALIYENVSLADTLRMNGVPITEIPGSRPSFSGAVALWRLLRSNSADVVHLHGILMWVCIVGLLSKNTRWILHVHSYPARDGSIKARINRSLVRWLCDAFVCVSHSVENEARIAFGSSRTFVVHNGIKVPSLAPNVAMSSGEPVFGIAMRLTEDKGTSCIVPIASALAEKCSFARILIAGDGPARADLELQLKKLCLPVPVTMLGHCDPMSNFWSRVDASFFVSPRDTFGLTILESVAHGVPVFGYISGSGSDEVLQALAPEGCVPRGEASQLVSRALAITRDLRRLEQIRSESHSRASRDFNIEACAKAMVGVYNNVLSS